MSVCFVIVSGPRRLWVPCCAAAAAALDEAPWRRGQHRLGVKVQGGWMRGRRADPSAGLPVLPGWRGAARRPGYWGGGAGQGGEGADRSAHPGHHPRARTQPFAPETHRWVRELTWPQFHDYFQELGQFARFADVLKGVGDGLFPLSAPSDVNGGIFIKVFTPHPSLSIPAFTLFHAHTHILASLASSYANSEVWECLNLECEGEITVYINILNLSAVAIRMTCTAYAYRKPVSGFCVSVVNRRQCACVFWFLWFLYAAR